MDHEAFVKLAQETALTPQGNLLRLAPHVRLLYTEVRNVLEQGNAYLYIADVFVKARGEKIDAGAIAERIRVYHFRDRQMRGEEPVARGSRTLLLKKSVAVGSKRSIIDAAQKHDESRFEPEEVHDYKHQGSRDLPGELQVHANDIVKKERMALTHAAHKRHNRRVTIPSGG